MSSQVPMYRPRTLHMGYDSRDYASLKVTVFLFFLFLVGVGGIAAADIQVEENPVPLNSFAVVKYKLEKGDDLIWDVVPEPTKLRYTVEGDYSVATFNGPAKTKYLVTADVVNFETKKRYKKKDYVTIGTGKVEPFPPNPVPPDPTPTPDVVVDGPVKVFIVEETANRTTAIAKLLGDVKFWDDLEKEGYIMRPYDITSPEARTLNLDKIKQPLPFMVVSSAKGDIVGSAVPLPLTKEDVRKQLPKIKVKIGELSTPVQYVTYPSTPFIRGYECVNGKCYPIWSK